MKSPKHFRSDRTIRIETPDAETQHFVVPETGFLQNALVLARDKYDENAAQLRKIEKNPDGSVHPRTAASLAEQFERQAEQISEFVDMLERSGGIALLHVGPEGIPEEEPSGPRI